MHSLNFKNCRLHFFNLKYSIDFFNIKDNLQSNDGLKMNNVM